MAAPAAQPRASTPALPDWLAHDAARGILTVDPQKAYPLILGELGVKESDWDQYWVETAYQCSKLEAQRIVSGTALDPRPQKPLVIHILSDGESKGRWALASFRPGKGAEAATRGREAIEHYRRWRGFVTG